MESKSKFSILTNGILKENPTFIMILGTCPTLGTTTSAFNGLGMGVATLFVLVMSNIFISLLKNLIPDKVRIPAYIVVIATFVTIVDLSMNAYVPALYKTLGIFIPLIVVNCIVLGRAEAFASKNSVLDSTLDGIGMGIGFTLALVMIGGIREILGSGKIFGLNLHLFPGDGILVFILAPGGFLVFGYLMALIINLNKKLQKS